MLVQIFVSCLLDPRGVVGIIVVDCLIELPCDAADCVAVFRVCPAEARSCKPTNVASCADDDCGLLHADCMYSSGYGSGRGSIYDDVVGFPVARLVCSAGEGG